MKRFICFLLCFLILLNVFSILGSAAEGDNPEDAVTVVYMKDGKETVLGNYSKLSLAAEAVGALYDGLLDGSVVDSDTDEDTNNSNELYAAAGYPVIKINCDIIGDSVCPQWVLDGYTKDNVPTIVIDGAKSETENYTVTCDDITLFDKLAFYNLTVRNTDMIFNRTNTGKDKLDNNIRWDGNLDHKLTQDQRIPGESYTVFENCLMDQNSSMAKASGDGGLFKMNGYAKNLNGKNEVEGDIFNLTLKDCTVFSDSAVGLQVHWGADANIYLENTTWTLDGVAGCGNNNDVILKCYESGDIYMKLDGSSKLIGERSEGSETIALFRSLPTMGGSITYELDAGAELRMNNKATKSLSEQHFIASGAKDVTVIDRGAIFTVSDSSVVSSKITLPKETTYTGFLSGGNLYPAGEKVNAVGSYSGISYDAGSFGVLEGASVRSDPNEYGLRFTAYFSNELFNSLSPDTEIGMVILPASSTMADPAADKNAILVKATDFEADTANDRVTFHGARMFTDTSDLKTICSTSYTARAYYMLTSSSGEKIRLYSAVSEGSARSMYSSVTKLCEKDASFKDHPAVKNIIQEAEAIGAHEIITGAYPESDILKSAPGCNQIILTNASFEYIYDILVSHGFKKLNVDRIEGAKMETVLLSKSSDLVTIYWYEETKNMRIMWENVSNTDLDLLAPNDSTGTGTILTVQVGIERVTERDNPLNGICNVTKLSDGTAIILDGGMPNDPCAKNLYGALEKLDIAKNEKGQYIIRAWLFSHYHGDHTGAIQNFANLYGDKVEVMYVMHAFSGETRAAGNGGKTEAIAALFPNAQYVNPHGGIKYYIGNATISMLYTPDMLYSYAKALAYDNDTSIIYKLEGGGASAIFYGDSGEEASKAMWNAYESSAFKVDILHITHHALYTQAGNGHGWTYLKKVYEATEATYAVLPMHSKYGPDSRNGRYTVMIQWCNAGYQISFVMNESDNHGKSSISQAYYDSFVESVKNGTNTYETLYGYDGINKIISEDGLITYTAGNNYTPMVTAFEFADGNVSLTLNEELYKWLGVDNSVQ